MACATTALFGMCSALAPSYWWYLVLRCLAGAGVAGVSSTAFLLAVEPVGPAWRGVATLGSGYGAAAGGCLLPVLAFLLPGWRALTFVTSALAGLALCTAVPVVPESPRWLLSTGRKVTKHACCPLLMHQNTVKLAWPTEGFKYSLYDARSLARRMAADFGHCVRCCVHARAYTVPNVDHLMGAATGGRNGGAGGDCFAQQDASAGGAPGGCCGVCGGQAGALGHPGERKAQTAHRLDPVHFLLCQYGEFPLGNISIS